MRFRGSRLFAALAAIVTALVIVPSAQTTSAPKGVTGTPLDVLHVGPDVSGLSVETDAQATARAVPAPAAQSAAVGEVRNWLALDDAYGTFYRKQYALRGIGQHIDVWVASELNLRAPAPTALPPVGQSSNTDFLD